MSDVGSISSPGSIPPIEKYSLKGSIGVDAHHAIAPSFIDLREGLHIFQPYLIQASKSRKITVVHLEELGLPRPELADINWKGCGDPCRTIIICPILPTTGEQVEGFLVLGNNPRIPFDEDYQQFAHLMMRLLSTSLASVVLFDEEVRQKDKAIGQAAELQEHLLAELQMKEKKFQRFAERSDVAIFILDPLGNFTYRNQRWYEMFEAAAGNDDAMSAWLLIAFAEDLPFVESVFAKLVVHHEPVILELKTRMAWMPPAELSQPEYENADHNRWILCSAYPELGPNGELVEIVGNITDISRQKWAEGIQKLRTDSALESSTSSIRPSLL
jgi:PAS domain-containing protein